MDAEFDLVRFGIVVIGRKPMPMLLEQSIGQLREKYPWTDKSAR